MLRFSEKLTHTPWGMKERDVVDLRNHGLADEQILGVVLVAAFFNTATRVADALGVELDAPFTHGTPENREFLESPPEQ
jgi:alkylhydroperoxidase family enzyme